MRYSNFAKIVDPQSEYYGKVFEVYEINPFHQWTVLILEKDDRGVKTKSPQYLPNEIQFCVTKDNAPVKIGEEKEVWESAREEFDSEIASLMDKSEYSKYVGSFHRQSLKRFVGELALKYYNLGKRKRC